MTEPSALHALSRAQLASLAEAFESGRLGPPYSSVSVHRYAGSANAVALAAELQRLDERGVQSSELGWFVRAIAVERAGTQISSDRVELVWTGPEESYAASRDTGVVVRELFSAAEESVYIAGFAVFNGRDLFKTLAQRMAVRPELQVRMFLNVHRKTGETRAAETIVQDFAEDFIQYEWPKETRTPELYYDPRSLLTDSAARAVLHAKTIVMDCRCAFVTSANFTEAAQNRNIEAGVIVRDEVFARTLQDHLLGLIERGLVLPAGR